MDRLEQRLALDLERLHGRDVRQPRKVLGVVRVERVARGAGGDVHDRLGRLVLDRHLVARQQPCDVHERLAWKDDRTVTLDLRGQACAQ